MQKQIIVTCILHSDLTHKNDAQLHVNLLKGNKKVKVAFIELIIEDVNTA